MFKLQSTFLRLFAKEEGKIDRVETPVPRVAPPEAEYKLQRQFLLGSSYLSILCPICCTQWKFCDICCGTFFPKRLVKKRDDANHIFNKLDI